MTSNITIFSKYQNLLFFVVGGGAEKLSKPVIFLGGGAEKISKPVIFFGGGAEKICKQSVISSVNLKVKKDKFNADIVYFWLFISVN